MLSQCLRLARIGHHWIANRCPRVTHIGHIWTRLDTFRQNHSPHDDSRGGNSQKSRESCGFAVCRQEERQHCHNEDAKAEARGALHKTGPDAQQEYGYHNTTHRYSVMKKSISLPLLAAGLE